MMWFKKQNKQNAARSEEDFWELEIKLKESYLSHGRTEKRLWLRTSENNALHAKNNELLRVIELKDMTIKAYRQLADAPPKAGEE